MKILLLIGALFLSGCVDIEGHKRDIANMVADRILVRAGLGEYDHTDLPLNLTDYGETCEDISQALKPVIEEYFPGYSVDRFDTVCKNGIFERVKDRLEVGNPIHSCDKQSSPRLDEIEAWCRPCECEYEGIDNPEWPTLIPLTTGCYGDDNAYYDLERDERYNEDPIRYFYNRVCSTEEN